MLEELILEVKNVKYTRDGVTLLNNISFSLKKGEAMVIFGTEDSGISHLFDVIIRGDVSFEGDVLYKGSSIKELDYFSLMEYKEEIGYLHGDYGLISNLSVEQNISLPLEYHSSLSGAEIKNYVNKLIFDLNLDHCKKLRPFQLSRSEILKTAFARSIANEPDLLYLEHAFENQCYLNILTIFDILKKRIARKDKSLIIVTYRPENFIDIANRFIMFFNGRIVFEGSKDEFLYSQNPYLIQYKTNNPEGPMVIL
jgi:phospholipid/cholesterol/gamma-HCH transport system ATP-binding protein